MAEMKVTLISRIKSWEPFYFELLTKRAHQDRLRYEQDYDVLLSLTGRVVSYDVVNNEHVVKTTYEVDRG